MDDLNAARACVVRDLGRQRRDVERLGEVPVHAVTGPPDADEVVAVHVPTVPRHVAGVTREPSARVSYAV